MEFKKREGKIYWGLLIMLVIGTVFLNHSVFFVLSVFYLLVVLFQNGLKFTFPRIPGLKLYLFLIAYSFVVGCFFFAFRNVARDILYFLLTPIWVFIGANIARKKNFNMHLVYRTLYLFAIINSICCLAQFIIAQNWSFEGIRKVFVTGVYDIGFLLPIIVLNSVFSNKYAFSKRTDNYIIIILCVHIFASIGRISILVPLLCVTIVLGFTLKYKKGQRKNLKKIGVLFGTLIVIGVTVFLIIPDDIIMFFSEKIFGTFEEINSTQIFNSTESAMNNWRGYEMQAAFEQWQDSSVFQQVFGSGLGKGIHIKYVPYSWVDMVENNEIPLLHNGFYTALIKMGILGTGSLITVFAGTFVRAIKRIRYSLHNIDAEIILIVLSVGCAIYTYIANGLIGQTPFLVWGLLMGMYNAKKTKYKGV